MGKKLRRRSTNQRGSGILLHVTSLPSPCGIGDLGPSAYRFVDFLSATSQRYWQILPLNPTLQAYDNSPYLSSSAFAANTLLISPELMERDGFLGNSWNVNISDFPNNRVDYDAVVRYKKTLFSRAFEQSRNTVLREHDYKDFCHMNAWWLDDFAIFHALAGYYGNNHARHNPRHGG